jgi:hypothetical protein
LIFKKYHDHSINQFKNLLIVTAEVIQTFQLMNIDLETMNEIFSKLTGKKGVCKENQKIKLRCYSEQKKKQPWFNRHHTGKQEFNHYRIFLGVIIVWLKLGFFC